MKLLIMPSNIDQITSTIDSVDGYIIGLEKLSINSPVLNTLDELLEINKICKKHNKELFVSLNKNMFNSDLELLKNTLITIDKLDINGILYYDVAIVNLKEELNLKTELIWSQEHLTTNYLTSNYWSDFKVSYTYLSSEITIEEINEICKNSNTKTIMNVFGYLPMFASRRHLVSNYLDTFNLKDDSKINYIEKEGKKYQIIDSNEGTIAYSSYIFSALKDIFELDVDYGVLNSFSIKDDDFYKVVKIFKNISLKNHKESLNTLDNMFNISTGFLHKETIFKVKKND